MSWTPAWMCPEIWASPLDHAVQALGQPAQVLAAVGADGGPQVAVGDPGGELGVVAHRRLERLARVPLVLGRVGELAVALVGQRAQAHQRQAEPDAGRHQRGGGQPERDLVDVVQRADEQDQQRQAGGHARDREARAGLLELGLGRPVWRPTQTDSENRNSEAASASEFQK